MKKNIARYNSNHDVQPYTVIQYEQPYEVKQSSKISTFKKKAWVVVGIGIMCYIFLSFNSIDTIKWRIATLVAFPIAVVGSLFLAIKSDGSGVKCHKLDEKNK